MKRIGLTVFVGIALLLSCYLNSYCWAGVAGIPDKVRANTLIVPFFEVGIDPATHPHDTFLVICRHSGSGYVHLHVWNVNGNNTSLYRNYSLSSGHCEDISVRDLISSASSSVKGSLEDGGDFYRGFITIDVVTSSTSLAPTASGYPLGSSNDLTGYIYYVRLAEGSSNGVSMIPIEYVGTSLHRYQYGFYKSDDGLEEIDADARACAATIANGGSNCSNNAKIDKIYARVFLSDTYNGKTRLVVFTWDPEKIGGPSTYCHQSLGCAESYTLYFYNKNGTIVFNKSVRLDRVVNIIEFTTATGSSNTGYAYLLNVAAPSDYQVYALVFNSANPGTINGVNMNWDAIFEGFIVP